MLGPSAPTSRRTGFFPAGPEAYGLVRVRAEIEQDVPADRWMAVRPHPEREAIVNLGEMLMVSDPAVGGAARWWLEWATFDREFDYRFREVERFPPTFKPHRQIGEDVHYHSEVPAAPWGTTLWEAGEDVPWWSVGARTWGHPRHVAGHDGMTRWSPELGPTPARALYQVGDENYDHYFELPRHGGLPGQRLKEVTRDWDGQGYRTIRILLPRGYDVEKRNYPVCYWHDGQNMFAKSRPLGHWVEPWGLAQAVERLTRTGEITDAIHVAIDQTDRRLLDYMPPSDQFDLDDDPMSGRAGEADRYLGLLRDHIHPYIVGHYRVMDDPRYTGMAGSSMGGLVTMFSGWKHTDFARRLGVFSASFWAAPGFLNEIESAGSAGRRPLLVYLDSGTVGPTHDNIDGVLRVRDALLRQGWTLGFDLKHVVGLGDPHNERAWRRRLDDCLRFLYPAGDAFYAEAEELYAERVQGTVWQRLEAPTRTAASGAQPDQSANGNGAEDRDDDGQEFRGGGFAW